MNINEKATLFAEAISNVMTEEIGIEELEATEDFTAILLGIKYWFNKLTGQELDIIEITHMLNRLAVAYILEE